MTDKEWLELALAPTCQEERDAVNQGPGPLRMWLFRVTRWRSAYCEWFKHDSTASIDAKLRRLKMQWGMEGYGLYWYLPGDYCPGRIEQ